MKKLKHIMVAVYSAMLVIVIYSCTSDNEYLKFAENGEVSYTAAIDSLKVYPGQNRVKVEGLIIGDPKVSEARIYWNNNTDSISIPITRSANIDVVTQIIDGLEESVHNFVVKTFDSEGNSSIPVSRSAEVYGDRYIASLFNRPIISNVLVGNELTINFADMDLSTGVIGSEVQYVNTSDEQVYVFVDIEESSLYLSDYKEASSYNHRTAFVPVETSIDDFFTPYEIISPVPTPVLKNAAVPFMATESVDRWGVLAEPWITNDAAKNHDGLGGWDQWNDNIFNLESGWGSPYIVDGKIHQVVNAVPATFRLKVEVLSTNHNENADGSYFVISKGNTGLPNTADVETDTNVLAYKRVETAGSYSIEFTVDEATDISVGQVSTQNGDHFCNIISWEIIVVE